MKVNKFSTLQAFSVLIVVFSFFCHPFAVSAQEESDEADAKTRQPNKSAVVITADQPNIWTLEQAHYLLAQMHRRNLDLKAMPLGNLDANEINGVNIDVLKTLLEASVEYDEAKGLNNTLLKDQKVFNAERRPQLLQKQAQLQDESLALTRQIAELRIRQRQTDDEDEKETIQAQIDELVIVQTAVKEQITQVNAELTTLNAAGGDFKSPTLDGKFDQSKFSNTLDSAFSSAVKSVVDGFNNEKPKLNASLRLENYLQMQYEILSKQLTLLRDEVGPGEQIVFLEMPQSIRATYAKADKKWGQSWWKIRAYTTCRDSKINCIEAPRRTYAATSRSIGGEVSGISVFAQRMKNLPVIEDFSNDFFDSIVTDVEKVKKNGESAIEFGAILGQALDGLDEEPKNFSVEQQSVKTNLEEILKTSLKSADAVIPKMLAAIKSAEAEVETHQNTKKKAEMLKQLGALAEDIGNYKKYKLRNAKIEWLRLKMPDDINSAEDFLKKMGEIMKTLDEDLAAEKITLATLNSITAKEKRNDRYDSRDDDYSTTSEFIARLLKNDPAIKVIDLDENRQLNLVGDKPSGGEVPSSVFSEIIQQDVDRLAGKKEENQNQLRLENREARVIDLFPRQSSINVNDIKYRSSAFSLKLVFSLITGFGAGGNYQRSRERYSQFVQQELYSSGFGKGGREFGWTFNPMPGTNRLMSGVRTTYAVLVVPRRANTLLLQSTGCYYKRSERQLHSFKDALEFSEEERLFGKGACSESRSFIVPIPSAISDQSFWISRVDYQPAEVGKKVVVSIKGRDFSSQIGVLVNGVPLSPSLGLGQPFIVDDSLTKNSVTFDSTIKGSFERVDSGQIIVSFEMGKDYKGTPDITLIAPGRGLTLNSLPKLPVGVNDEKTKDDDSINLAKAPFMFGKKPDSESPKIEAVRLFKGQDKLTAIITGEKLKNVDSVDANGIECTIKDKDKEKEKNPDWKESFIRCTFAIPKEKKVFVTLIDNDGKSVQSMGIDNPAPEKPESDKLPTGEDYTMNAEFSISRVDFQNTQPIAGSTDEMVFFKLSGTGFTEKMRVDQGTLEPISQTEVLFKIEKSKTPRVITLLDDAGKRKARKEIIGVVPKTERRSRRRTP